MDLTKGKCPSCDKTGTTGEPCQERGCKKREYRFVPVSVWEQVHKEGSTPNPMIGVMVGDFLIVDLVGVGGFGKVYLALQAPLFELKGALKIIDFEAEEGIEEVLLEKFRVEAQTLAQVNHPNIVRLLKYGDHQGKPYLVMEYLAGGLTLQDEMIRRYEEKIPRDREFVTSVLEQVLHGLDHMHELGLIHRDIKPENIMLQNMAGNPWHVRLLDFGLAKSVINNDKTQLPMGTPMYMAPEQLYMTNLGPWTDLYAVASMACWLTTGLRPYPGNSRSKVIPKKLKKQYDPSARLAAAGVDAMFVKFFHDALHHDPEQRIRDVAEFRRRFHELLELSASEPEALPQTTTQSPTIALDSEELDILTTEASEEEVVEVAPVPVARTKPPEAVATELGERINVSEASSGGKMRRWFSVGAAVVGLLIVVLVVANVMRDSESGAKPLTKDAAAATTPPESFDRDALVAKAQSVQRGKDGVARATEQAAKESNRIFGEQSGALGEARELLGRVIEDAGVYANTPRVLDIAAGKFHTCALLWDGGVRCWGANKHGELGLGMKQNIGDDEPPYKSPRVNLGARAVALVAGGDRKTGHNCALGEDHKVRCWGYNKWGQLGYGHTDTIGDDETPDVAGSVILPEENIVEISAASAQFSGHSCARSISGRVWCWGRNNYGQLGYGHTDTIGDDETLAKVAPLNLGAKARSIASGKFHNCAILPRGSVRCWGRNAAGQLGQGHTSDIGDDESPKRAKTVRFPSAVEELALGRDHTCVRTKRKAVYCWGGNGSGQLGTGEKGNLGDTKAVKGISAVKVGFDVAQVVSGELHVCALSETGTVRCWGSNKFGQLGATHTRTVGDDEVPETQAEVPVGGVVKRLAAGSYHTCALLETGRVRCWGSNNNGQLGYGHTTRIGDSETPSHAGDIQIFGNETKQKRKR